MLLFSLKRPCDSPTVIDQCKNIRIVHFYDETMKLCQSTTNPKTNRFWIWNQPTVEPTQIHQWTRVMRRPENDIHEIEAESGNPSKIPIFKCFLYVKLVDIVEKDICMLSRDHLFQKKKR